MKRTNGRQIKAFLSIAVAALLLLLAAGPSLAQVVEVTEDRPVRIESGEDEKLSPSCLSAVESYEGVQSRIEERIAFLERVAVIGELVELKEDMEGRSAIPKECSKEVSLAVDSMIEKALDGDKDDVDIERVRSAASRMEADLMPEYLELSSAFDDVCMICGGKPKRLAGNPMHCAATSLLTAPEQKVGKRQCNRATVKYDNARDAILFRRDLCRQSAKIDGMDGILFWFQGRDDLPLTCAVEIKAFMDEMRSDAEGESDASKYAFAVAKEKCGKAMVPIYVRYGMAVKDVCDSCRDADSILGKNGMSCY